MLNQKIKERIYEYNPNKIRIGVLGSHSALEIASGAKQEGFETVVVCQKGRDKTYTKYYNKIFDHILLLDKFSEISNSDIISKLADLNTVFIPNRSFSVYAGYENIENDFTIPLLGNRYLLRTEERNTPRNQQYLLQKSGINIPKIFNSPEEIDRLVIVKVPEKNRTIERAFFYVSSTEEFDRISKERIKKGIITKAALDDSLIEEYVLGAKFNANFFWSPLTNEIDLLGFDRRIQTDLDGILDLPAQEQLDIKIPSQNIEIGHMGATMRESQIEKVFTAAEQFVETCKREYPPGMIGLFALQGAVSKDLKFYVFDLSPRVPGCPCVESTSPYMKYKYGFEVGPGRRVAMEVKLAIKSDRLVDVVT
jgi:5-formaminoimidazole-4-carboxamide-1-(beta)-D-ribofuranosyl 5'-monophosphate synthetase